MKRETENIGVLTVSFLLFAAGVWALYSAPGRGRSVVLWGSFALLAAIAVRQSLRKMKR